MRRLILVGLPLIASVPACTFQLDHDDDPADLRARLIGAPRFAIDPEQTEIGLGVERERDGRTERASLRLPVLDGEAVVELAGDDLVLADLMLELEPVTLPSDLHPGDTRLVDVRIHLPSMVRCDRTTWGDGGAHASCQVTTDLLVAWSLEIRGTSHPLGTITLPEIAIGLHVVQPDRAGERLRLDLDAEAAGEVWSWLGVIVFRDLTLRLRGDAP